MSNLKLKIFVTIINLLSKTWRIKINGKFPEKPSIVLFWHGKMLPVWKIFSEYNPVGVVSQSKDGQILSAILEKWNYRLIRGSSSKDGKEVLNKIIDFAGNNFILMTPDGPRGPKNLMKAGGIVSAQRAGVPVCLCGVEIKNKYIFHKSWDNFNLPIPFSSIILNFSECKKIDRNADRDYISNLIDEFTNELNMLDID